MKFADKTKKKNWTNTQFNFIIYLKSNLLIKKIIGFKNAETIIMDERELLKLNQRSDGVHRVTLVPAV